MWGIEYCLTPCDYDGVSEWRCCSDGGCGARFGRWSGVQLFDGQIEGRYGAGSPVPFIRPDEVPNHA